MKKLFALMLALVIAFGSGVAAAEGIDLDALSDDELLALMRRVEEEIVGRRLEGTATLSSGSYITGRDIPAGTYIFTSLAKGDDWGNVTIYSKKGEGKQLFWEIVSAPEEGEEPESFFITLNEDDRLKSDVPFSLTVFAGVRFR